MSGLPAVGHGTLWMQMGFTHVANGYPDDDPTAWLCACLAGYLTPTGMFMSALFKSLCVKVALKGFDPHQLGGLDPGLKVQRFHRDNEQSSRTIAHGRPCAALSGNTSL